VSEPSCDFGQLLIYSLVARVINKPVAPPIQPQQRLSQQHQSQQSQLVTAPVSAAIGADTSANDTTPVQVSRPRLLRENSSNSGTTTPAASFPVRDEDSSDLSTVAGQRPASHPPSSTRSHLTDADEADSGLRSRPQTMPANGSLATHEESHSPPKEVSRPYRYQDYVATAGSAEPVFNGHQKVTPNGRPEAAFEGTNGSAWQDPSTVKPKRFSSESAESDDVRYDSRRSTAEMDTYDIISA